jgi:hypothetical protein
MAYSNSECPIESSRVDVMKADLSNSPSTSLSPAATSERWMGAVGTNERKDRRGRGGGGGGGGGNQKK